MSVVCRCGHSECWAQAKETEEQGYGLAASVFGEEDGRVQENIYREHAYQGDCRVLRAGSCHSFCII